MKNTIVKVTLVIALAMLFVPAFSGLAKASTLALNFDDVFSGPKLSGTAPWITAMFDDTTASNGYDVRLTLTASNLVGSDYIEALYFNLDPALNASKLQFKSINKSAVGPVTISEGNNAFKADSDGKYDFMISFSDANFKKEFTNGESVVYDIKYKGKTNVDAASFDFFSKSVGKNGPFLAVAEVENVGKKFGECCGCCNNDKDSWISAKVAPEPVSCSLFLLGGAGLAFARRKRND